MSTELRISPSPHVHGQSSTRRIMLDVVYALLPAWLVGVYFFGIDALLVTLVSIITCMACEYLLARYVLRIEPTLSDGSALVTGLLLAMNLPSGIPLWIVVIGGIVAIGIAKMSFGGLGNNLFNPALTARALLLISFPMQMTTWPLARCGAWCPDGTTGATVLSLVKSARFGKGFGDMPGVVDMLLGKMGGSFGEVSAIALLLGGIYLLFRHVISWHIPLSVLVGATVLSGAMWLSNSAIYASPVVHLLSGGMLLGAIFMATDYATSPMSKPGMLIYGLCIGLLAVTIRIWGAYPEGMSFAILIMNAMVPLINRYVKPRKFGVARRRVK
ncbi:MAG: RnfABCDGE type electron transport complex subunit D [Bacteroidia bacterium]|nr:RnfABCDGE type electron transport complex subunit D [Bacteroidia bacterium]MBB1540755.1 RnfABCDGE type electron transport complex subunit D [Bacteroidia bacterium]